MGYILDPSEVREWIEEINTWLDQLEERYQSALAVIKEFSESEDLEGKAYNKMKEDFLTYHSLAVHGAAEAKESIRQDLMILGETIGTEYLDGDLLDEQIEEQKKTCRHYEDVLDHLYHLSRVPFFDYYLEPLIESNRKLLELSEGILDRLKEKLEKLYDIGNSTRFLFDNASDWLSAVSSAIEDLQVTITGEGNLSNGSWKGLLIPSFEEKVGRLENFKGGSEWNGFTIKEKINQLKDMIEETTETMPKERREWIENEIRKIIPNLTPEEREGFKTAMREHGLKYDEIGLAWNDLTTEGRFRRVKRMIEKTTETMPKVRMERIEGKIKELIPYLSNQEKQELKTAMKAHGLEYDESGCDAVEGSENDSNYSDALVEFVKQGEGLWLTPYNNEKTIAYGFDYYLRPDIKINWNEDGSITEAEAERLLRIILDESENKLSSFLNSNNLTLNQNAYDVAIDLYYNRNSNQLTQEVVVAMANRDDKKVEELLSDFDYRYALVGYVPGITKGDTQGSQAYVDRNPGLITRRAEEYSIYKNGYK